MKLQLLGAKVTNGGEEVVAFIVAEKGYQISLQVLDKHCLEHIARFKRPKRYLQVSELPKNNYGKVLKTTLRENLSKISKAD